MAIYNEILIGRYNRALQKLLSMKGPASMNQLAPELLAVINTFYGAENRYLEGWETFLNIGRATSGAGNTVGVRLRNPAGSGVIAVVVKTSVSSGNNDIASLQGGNTNADLGAPTLAVRNNMDVRTRVSPSCSLSVVTAPTTLNVWAQYRILANTVYDQISNENQEITILPGDAIEWQNNAASTDFMASFMWRERVLEDSELK